MPDLFVYVSGNAPFIISFDDFADYGYAGFALYPGTVEIMHHHCRRSQLDKAIINKKALKRVLFYCCK